MLIHHTSFVIDVRDHFSLSTSCLKKYSIVFISIYDIAEIKRCCSYINIYFLVLIKVGFDTRTSPFKWLQNFEKKYNLRSQKSVRPGLPRAPSGASVAGRASPHDARRSGEPAEHTVPRVSTTDRLRTARQRLQLLSRARAHLTSKIQILVTKCCRSETSCRRRSHWFQKSASIQSRRGPDKFAV